MATSDSIGDALIAPARLGNVAVIKMDGSAQYVLGRAAFLARSPNVQISTRLRFGGVGVTQLVAHGKGSLAVSAYGGVFRLVLNPGEEYYADPRFLVAWDAGMDPLPQTVSAGASAPKGFLSSFLSRFASFFARRVSYDFVSNSSWMKMLFFSFHSPSSKHFEKNLCYARPQRTSSCIPDRRQNQPRRCTKAWHPANHTEWTPISTPKS
jgi:hypothetical protein